MACTYCGDTFKAWRCGSCNATIGAACPECHAEKSHGEIGPPLKTRGSRGDAAATRRGLDFDPSPMDENTTRNREDGGR